MSRLQPEQEPPIRFFAEVTATAIFWGLWLYVVMPLVSLLLWLAGIDVFVEQMITLGGYQAFLEKLLTYGLVVLMIMLVVFVWVTWNVRRYGGAHNTRTRTLAPVTLAETAEAAGTEPDVIERLQMERRLVVGFDEQDRLLVFEGAAANPARRKPGPRS
jgi:poly-beta-1,6-N-acetyl-D-glucosamine biosynthesis protein PgaD